MLKIILSVGIVKKLTIQMIMIYDVLWSIPNNTTHSGGLSVSFKHKHFV